MDSLIRLGIDFGTTNCAIGRVLPDGRMPVNGPIPSLGVIADGMVCFGDEARELLKDGRADLFPIRNLKLDLCEDRLLTPKFGTIDLASALLKYLRDEYYPDDKIESVVVGTPVKASRRHRANLREATRRAGFTRCDFVYEPTAALIGSWTPSVSRPGNVLVVDWGGGTLDLAVIQVREGLFHERGVHGDFNELGGSLIDKAIVRKLLDDPAHRRAREIVDARLGGYAAFLEAVEEKKILLLESEEGEDAEPELVNPVWLPSEVPVPPVLIWNVIREFAAKAGEQIDKLIRNAGLQSKQITHILFAGGVCKTEAIRRHLRDRLPWAEPLSNPEDLQLQTALGCVKMTSPKHHASVELASDLVVRQCDESLCIVLPKGQPVRLNSFRIADFLVTDVNAPEAVIELGVNHELDAVNDSSARVYETLEQVYLPVGRPELPGREHIPDIVRMHVGIDDCLAVRVRLESNRSRSYEERELSAVPLAIRIGEPSK